MTTSTRTGVALMGHLMRRAAFGAPAGQLETLAARGYEAVVDDLLHPERFPPLEEDLLERFHTEHSDDESTGWTATRWIFQMINSPRPLEYKMALFWHGLFATAVSKVTNNPMMRDQFELFRDHGLANFRTILQKLARDPAMIYWLDQQQNHATAVNENWGRELLELFSMGRGNYTEDDVRAAARAFTGWTIDQTFPRYPSGYYGVKFIYREQDHDHSPKTFLGATGDFNGDDIIEIVLKQPATAQFVARQLHRFFVSDDPDPAAIDRLSRAFVDSGYDIRAVMRFLFLSDFFKAARFKKVKCPVELVVGTARTAGRFSDPWEFGIDEMERLAARMGQELFNPPTVEGWHTGREWIDSSYLIERVNYAAGMLGVPAAPGVAAMAGRIATGRQSIRAGDLVDAVLYEMGALTLTPADKKELIQNLELAGDIPCGASRAAPFAGTVARIARTIASSREYQLE